MPGAVHQRPGAERTDALCIADDARVDIADAVLVVIREGQRLQMIERRITQIAVDANLREHRAEAGGVVDQRREDNGRNVDGDEVPDGIERSTAHEMIQRIAL